MVEVYSASYHLLYYSITYRDTSSMEMLQMLFLDSNFHHCLGEGCCRLSKLYSLQLLHSFWNSGQHSRLTNHHES